MPAQAPTGVVALVIFLSSNPVVSAMEPYGQDDNSTLSSPVFYADPIKEKELLKEKQVSIADGDLSPMMMFREEQEIFPPNNQELSRSNKRTSEERCSVSSSLALVETDPSESVQTETTSEQALIKPPLKLNSAQHFYFTKIKGGKIPPRCYSKKNLAEWIALSEEERETYNQNIIDQIYLFHQRQLEKPYHSHVDFFKIELPRLASKYAFHDLDDMEGKEGPLIANPPLSLEQEGFLKNTLAKLKKATWHYDELAENAENHFFDFCKEIPNNDPLSDVFHQKFQETSLLFEQGILMWSMFIDKLQQSYELGHSWRPLVDKEQLQEAESNKRNREERLSRLYLCQAERYAWKADINVSIAEENVLHFLNSVTDLTQNEQQHAQSLWDSVLLETEKAKDFWRALEKMTVTHAQTYSPDENDNTKAYLHNAQQRQLLLTAEEYEYNAQKIRLIAEAASEEAFPNQPVENINPNDSRSQKNLQQYAYQKSLEEKESWEKMYRFCQEQASLTSSEGQEWNILVSKAKEEVAAADFKILLYDLNQAIARSNEYQANHPLPFSLDDYAQLVEQGEKVVACCHKLYKSAVDHIHHSFQYLYEVDDGSLEWWQQEQEEALEKEKLWSQTIGWWKTILFYPELLE